MLSKEEKELLEALEEHLDDEQKEALGEMSEEDIKDFLEEARKEAVKEMGKPQTKLRMMYAMGFGDFMKAYGGKSFIQALIVFLFVKQSKGSGGRLFLFLLVDIAVVVGLCYLLFGRG